MQRQRGELVPLAEALSELPGPVQALREATPQSLHHFTQADQVNQLATARESDRDLGFQARMMALCSLPRTNPGNRLQYVRKNGPYGGNSENGKNRTLSDQQRSASDLNRRVCGVSPHQAFQLHSGLEFFLLGRGDLCGQLDLEIAQSIGLTGGNPKTTSLSTAPLAYDFFRFLRRPLGSPRSGFQR